MNVLQYEAKFTELFRFVPNFVQIEATKCRRFQGGLQLAIKLWVEILQVVNYTNLVVKAIIAEKWMKEFERRSEPSKDLTSYNMEKEEHDHHSKEARNIK